MHSDVEKHKKEMKLLDAKNKQTTKISKTSGTSIWNSASSH